MPCLTEIQKRGDGWWFTYLADAGEGECGPYRTRSEAEDDARGVVRFYRLLRS